MAAQDNRDDAELSSSNLDAKLDRYRDPNKPTKSSSKSKDLSHVPCKFFKVGSCTAGQSCPFSHQIQQPGQAKDVCAWFVKGNCKFGHKCALAHILPGQSPSMDRRNKKAAQLAAAAAAGNSGGNNNNSHTHSSSGGGTRDRERDRERDRTRKSASSSASTSGSGAGGHGAGRGGGGIPSRSNTLLSGSTAPTRVLPTGARPPLPISISKAAPAPAETAPALRDADFTSRDALALPKPDDQAQAQTQNGANVNTYGDGEASNEQAVDNNANVNTNINPSNGVGIGVSSPPNPAHTSPFPVSTPPRPHRFAARHGSSPSIDFGPVGSPPRTSSAVMSMNNNSGPIRINGFSPGTSPTGRDPVQGTQPLAAPPVAGPGAFGAHGPGAANLFMDPSSPRGAGSGVAASLSLSAGAHPQGPLHTQPFAVGSLPVLSRPIPDSVSYSEALDEEDMEEFVPSSLKDLLTPEEQSRRMSRTSSSHMTSGTGVGGGTGGIPTSVARSTIQREGLDTRHRHSQSVPGTSLLSENLRSIWSDNNPPGTDNNNNNNNPGFGLSPSAGVGGLGATASPSFASSPGLQHAFDYDFENEGPSPSMLSPSNASAAFLGMGMHQYMGAGPGGSSRVPGGISGVRNVSQGNVHHHSGLTGGSTGSGIGVGNTGGILPSASSSFDPHRLHGHAGSGLSSSPSQLPRSPFDTIAFSSSPSKYSLQHSTHRPVPNTASHAVGGFPVPEQALSPASRALQAHVPGQSLPQGLAAGFSRIHLQSTGMGTGTSMAFSPGSGSGSQGGEGLGSIANGAGGMGMEWMSATPTKSNHFDQQAPPMSPPVNNTFTSEHQGPTSANPTIATNTGNEQSQTQPQPDVSGLTSMFSHLSYSSVTAGSGLRSLPPSAAPTSMSMSMSRRSSGRGVGVGGAWPHPHPLSSPLSGPVLTNDDDELFSMDEEK